MISFKRSFKIEKLYEIKKKKKKKAGSLLHSDIYNLQPLDLGVLYTNYKYH